MSILTINYSKKNSFLKDKTPIYQQDQHFPENNVQVGEYRKATIPKTNQTPRILYNTTHRKWVIETDQKELNSLVKACGFTYQDGPRKGVLIETANLRDGDDAFFNHPELTLELISGSATVDTDYPPHAVWEKVFKTDPRFKLAGEDGNPAIAAKVLYTVAAAGYQSVVSTKKIDEGIEAIKLLDAMDYSKRLKVISAMGVAIGSKPSPELITSILYEKITDGKDLKTIDNYRNIDLFLLMAKSEVRDLDLRDRIAKAKARNIIVKRGQGYQFQEVSLGRTLEDVAKFLAAEENEDIKNSIIKTLG